MNAQFLRFILPLILSLLCIESFGEKNKKTLPADLELLKKTIQRYQSAGEIEMKVKKTLVQEILSKETIYEGKLYLSKGKIRWENSTPEKSLLVFDGTTLWEVQHSQENSDTPTQVAKAVVGDKGNKPDLLLSILSRDKAIDKTFKARRVSAEKTFETFELQAKEKMSIKDLMVSVTKTTRTIEKMKFIDDVGNSTTLEFADIKFFESAKPSHFKYKPPVGAQITNL